MLNLWPPARGQIWSQGYNLKKFDRDPLGKATYQIW